MGWDISLSASKLNVLRECELCFWLMINKKLEQIRGIFPSLPGGMDRIMKEYCDRYRGSLPPELVGKVPGKLWGTPAQIAKLRHWKSGLKAEIRTKHGVVSLIGALDDLTINEDGGYAPVDGKSKGSTPKDDGAQYYQGQLDIYALILQENGLPPTGKGYLWYFWPVSITNGIGSIGFDSTVYALRASADEARKTIEYAMQIIKGPQPNASDKCEHCKFSDARMSHALTMVG